MVRVLLCLALLGSLLSPTSAVAKPSPKSGAKAGGGKAEFEKAMRFYQAQEYEAALPWFQRAYELSGRRPSTIRALAQCERSLKLYERAIEHFREYLATQPTPSDAESVSETVRLLEEIVAEKSREATPPPKDEPKEELALVPAVADPPAPPAPPLVVETAPEPEPKLAAWSLVGGGGAAIVAGTVLLALGLSAASTVESAPAGTPFEAVRGDADAAPVLSGVGIGLLAAGALATGGGLVWLLGD